VDTRLSGMAKPTRGLGDATTAPVALEHAPQPPAARRVVAHFDLDAFYAQVEYKRHPDAAGKALAVVQYNPVSARISSPCLP